jgi:rubrerythrin
MSYLSAPRLIFAGQFQADVSTVNNDPEHFDTSNFRSNYQLPGSGVDNGWWNPNGSGAWRFRGCTVQSVVYRDGTTCDDPNVDPIVGAVINDSDARVEGKLVDLDPEQQMVSQIWGFRIVLGQPPQRAQGIQFQSDFEVTPFADIWIRQPSGQADSFFSAFYQSVLHNVEWSVPSPLTSRFLQEISYRGKLPPELSIRFNVDGIDDDMTSQQFTFGRVVGAIGLHYANEPTHFLAARALSATQQPPLPPPSVNTNTAYAQLDGNVLSLDLSNSLPTQSPGGPLINQGRLYAALLLPDGAQPMLLGEIDYQTPNWYEQTGGIVSFKLNAKQLINQEETQLDLAKKTPLGVVQWGNGFQPLLAEAPNGLWLRADDFVFRINASDEASTTFYATKFGVRAADQEISLIYDASLMEGFVQQDPSMIPGPPVGTPQSAITFPSSIKTGSDGTVQLTLKTTELGYPRTYIDGQVYGISYGPAENPPTVGSVQNPSMILNALVFSSYKAPDEPTWLSDVQPIFQQYADLYPVMRPIVDLADYASVVGKLKMLKHVFDTPITDPNYMPVTRDLSKPKQDMIRKWLDRPVYMRLDSVEDLMTALQQAIELEHSTIPPYLTALYTIKQGTNVEVAELIRSVVIEEMLHMAQIANVLISLGGKPQIGNPGFVPIYPGPLPGGLLAGLSVRLRRCSITQIRDVFMAIEQPEFTVEPVKDEDKPGDPIDVHRYTIGWFYDEIERALTDLSKAGKISFGNAKLQVSDWTGTGKLYVVTSLDQALEAINEIKRQGEGATPLKPGDGDAELAHYYKFSEIVEGRRIVVDETGYSYTGDNIPFDEKSIWPMMDDPDSSRLPKGSRALILSEQFAQTYQALLNGLNRTFNGEPDYLGQAIGLMYSLSVLARQLVQTPSGLNDGTTAGPSFALPSPQ